MGESGGHLSLLTMTGGRKFLCCRYKRPAVSIGVRLGVKRKSSIIIVELELVGYLSDPNGVPLYYIAAKSTA